MMTPNIHTSIILDQNSSHIGRGVQALSKFNILMNIDGEVLVNHILLSRMGFITQWLNGAVGRLKISF